MADLVAAAARLRGELGSACACLRGVSKMGGPGDSPGPVGDPPTGMAVSPAAKKRCSLVRSVAPIPFGESPDGTGGSPVLPEPFFKHVLRISTPCRSGVHKG